MIYGAYFDESDESPGFAIGGYSAALDTWLHVDWAWKDLLKRWKLPYYKASECENGLKVFAQFRDNPKDQKSPLKPNERTRLKEIKSEFIDAIVKHRDDLQGYGTAVVIEDFNRIISESRIARKVFQEKPYYLGSQLCLVAAAAPVLDANKKRSGDNRIEISPIFDSHQEYSGIARQAFDNFMTKNPKSAQVLLQPQYESDIENSALQVADMLVYEIRKKLTQKIRNPEDEYMRVPLERLLPFIYRVYKLDYQSLKVIAAHQTPDTVGIPHLMPEELW